MIVFHTVIFSALKQAHCLLLRVFLNDNDDNDDGEVELHVLGCRLTY